MRSWPSASSSNGDGDTADEDEALDPYGYAGVKRVVKLGPNSNDPNRDCKRGTYCYQDTNYSILRIVLAYMTRWNGFTESDSMSENDRRTSASFLSYMNDNVFIPAGIPAVSGAQPSEPTLSYAFPHASARGVNWGDQTLALGASGFQLSSQDLATLMRRLHDGTLLGPTSLRLMKQGELGFSHDTLNHTERFGIYHTKGGLLVRGDKALKSRLFMFQPGIVVGAIVNSNTPVGFSLGDTIVEAYETSWVATN